MGQEGQTLHLARTRFPHGRLPGPRFGAIAHGHCDELGVCGTLRTWVQCGGECIRSAVTVFGRPMRWAGLEGGVYGCVIMSSVSDMAAVCPFDAMHVIDQPPLTRRTLP